MKSPLALTPALLFAVLTIALSGCGSSHYMSYDTTRRGFDKAEALEQAGDHRAAALAYEKLAEPPKPYVLEYQYQQAWTGAAKSWAAAGDDDRALAAFNRAVENAHRHEQYEAGKWPLFIASTELERARFLSTRQSEQAKAALDRLVGIAEAVTDGEESTTLGKTLHDAAQLLDGLGDSKAALRAALLGFDKDTSSQEVQAYYELPIRLARQSGDTDQATRLATRLEVVKRVSALIDSGQIPYAPYKKIGNAYTSTNYSKSQTAQFYRTCADAYRQAGQDALARNKDRHAALYQKWADEESQRAVATTSEAPSRGFGAQVLGGLLQGAGMAMQQQAGYSNESAARATLVQGVGAAIAGDQSALDQATRQSFNVAARQQAAQGDAVGAMASTLAAKAYTGQSSASAAANSTAASTAGSGNSTGACPDQLMYASGQMTSYRNAAAQFSTAELQDSFQRFQSCMQGGNGECYLFYRNGEPADYPLAALRGSAADPNDMNSRVFRCHAASGFASAQ